MWSICNMTSGALRPQYWQVNLSLKSTVNRCDLDILLVFTLSLSISEEATVWQPLPFRRATLDLLTISHPGGLEPGFQAL